MNDWGVPDWTDGTAYPMLESMPLRAWKCQFLRRNHEYRERWHETVAPFYDPSDRSIDYEAALAAAERAAEVDPEFQAFMASGDGTWSITSPPVMLCERFGVGDFPPPPTLATALISFASEGTPSRSRPSLKTLPADRPYAFSVSLKRSEVVVTFDVSQPIAPQIEGARKRIEAYATYLEGNGDIEIIKMRNRSDRWPTYLRLLDAADAGAKTGEIAAALFPTIENEDPDYKAGRHVRNWTAAAQELRDGGYRFMTLKHDK